LENNNFKINLNGNIKDDLKEYMIKAITNIFNRWRNNKKIFKKWKRNQRGEGKRKKYIFDLSKWITYIKYKW